mmetsp:Transcript_20586/g.22995  ORF Transcript_20586/g.22995 Transcript_20586/m.22995 type:complete len:206 (-) Transcript_20586:3124-3741(-)
MFPLPNVFALEETRLATVGVSPLDFTPDTFVAASSLSSISPSSASASASASVSADFVSSVSILSLASCGGTTFNDAAEAEAAAVGTNDATFGSSTDSVADSVCGFGVSASFVVASVLFRFASGSTNSSDRFDSSFVRCFSSRSFFCCSSIFIEASSFRFLSRSLCLISFSVFSPEVLLSGGGTLFAPLDAGFSACAPPSTLSSEF